MKTDYRIAKFQKAEKKRQFREELSGDYKHQAVCGDATVCLGAVLGIGFVMALGTAAVIIGR